MIRNLLNRLVNRLMIDAEFYRVRQTKKSFKCCGHNVEISPRAFLWGVADIEIGDNVCVHAFTHIFGGGGVTIGNGVRISTNCSISSIAHSIPHLDPLEKIERPVVIGKHVWIGMGAIILPGITIGDYAVVGAGAVVTKDVPSCTVVVGNPAKVVRKFDLPESLAN